MIRPKIICLTPVKNESWILEKFIQSASLWADHIIIADQNSVDDSRVIAGKYPKVTLIENNSNAFNESERQKLLLDEARKIEGHKIFITLDADEFLSANASQTDDWQKMLEQKPGTVIKFKWPFIDRNFKKYWSGSEPVMPFGFVDDGSPHNGRYIHSTRVPYPSDATVFQIHDFVVMHFQFTDWNRMISKHRWYQCYERIQDNRLSCIEIFRKYNHMYRIDKHRYHLIPDEWFESYINNGINIKDIKYDVSYWWDDEVKHFKNVYGLQFFKNVDIPESNGWIIKYLRMTRCYDSLLVKSIDKLIKFFTGV